MSGTGKRHSANLLHLVGQAEIYLFSIRNVSTLHLSEYWLNTAHKLISCHTIATTAWLNIQICIKIQPQQRIRWPNQLVRKKPKSV